MYFLHEPNLFINLLEYIYSEIDSYCQGADPNCVDKDGYPPLHLAVINKHVDAIPILVQEGAEVDKKGPT